MKKRLIFVVLAVISFIGAAWADFQFKPIQPSLQAMVSDVRVSLLGPRSGTRLEMPIMMVRGRVEGTGTAIGSTARIEMGLKAGRDYVASKTISARVGNDFSTQLEMPGYGPYQFYIGVVRLEHVVRSEDIAVRSREGRDLSTGSRTSLRIRLADSRGRRLDGRVVVYQRASIIGERYTSNGIADMYDLAAGEYQVVATSTEGWTALPLTVRVSSDYYPTYNLGLSPP